MVSPSEAGVRKELRPPILLALTAPDHNLMAAKIQIPQFETLSGMPNNGPETCHMNIGEETPVVVLSRAQTWARGFARRRRRSLQTAA